MNYDDWKTTDPTNLDRDRDDYGLEEPQYDVGRNLKVMIKDHLVELSDISRMSPMTGIGGVTTIYVVMRNGDCVSVECASMAEARDIILDAYRATHNIRICPSTARRQAQPPAPKAQVQSKPPTAKAPAERPLAVHGAWQSAKEDRDIHALRSLET